MTQTALTLSEAATACGVSRSTVKRKLSGFDNAYRDGDGVWQVPISDLLGAGLKLRPRPAEPVTQGHDLPVNGVDQGQNGAASQRFEELTAELAAERERRLVAETTVRLLTANLEDLRFSLRAISGPPRPPEVMTGHNVPEAAPEPVQAAPVGPRRAMSPIGDPRNGGADFAQASGIPDTPPRRGLWARIRGS